MPTEASAVVIGNEILSAKTEDLNGSLLLRRLREQGIRLKLLTIVPDELDPIVDAVRRAKAVAKYVFTSGGIGPTHDDVTVKAVAAALSRPVVRHQGLEKLVREHFGSAPPLSAMRLADVPEGTELLVQEKSWYPVLSCDNVFLLPGVPQFFRHQLEVVLRTLPVAYIHLRNLYLCVGEVEVAEILNRVADAWPQVLIGSYPDFAPSAPYRVKVTVEHEDGQSVEQTVAQLLRELPTGAVVRMD